MAIMGGYGPIAAHKVSHRACHFGGVFTFNVVGVMMLTFDDHGRSKSRAKRDFFKDFGYLASEIGKFCLPAGKSCLDMVPSSLILGRVLGYGAHL